MTVETTLTIEQIRETGYRALLRELGPVNLVRFFQQFETGYGDYTQERRQWLKQYQAVEQIVHEIRESPDAEKFNRASLDY